MCLHWAVLWHTCATVAAAVIPIHTQGRDSNYFRGCRGACSLVWPRKILLYCRHITGYTYCNVIQRLHKSMLQQVSPFRYPLMVLALRKRLFLQPQVTTPGQPSGTAGSTSPQPGQLGGCKGSPALPSSCNLGCCSTAVLASTLLAEEAMLIYLHLSAAWPQRLLLSSAQRGPAPASRHCTVTMYFLRVSSHMPFLEKGIAESQHVQVAYPRSRSSSKVVILMQLLRKAAYFTESHCFPTINNDSWIQHVQIYELFCP